MGVGATSLFGMFWPDYPHVARQSLLCYTIDLWLVNG
jgi:hypothetical protein